MFLFVGGKVERSYSVLCLWLTLFMILAERQFMEPLKMVLFSILCQRLKGLISNIYYPTLCLSK